jgi:hypothetical protein
MEGKVSIPFFVISIRSGGNDAGKRKQNDVADPLARQMAMVDHCAA